jgi:hypothetical protein
MPGGAREKKNPPVLFTCGSTDRADSPINDIHLLFLQGKRRFGVNPALSPLHPLGVNQHEAKALFEQHPKS